MEQYKNLFQPLQIKHMNLKNRVFMPPMGTNLLISMVLFVNNNMFIMRKEHEGVQG